MEAQDAGVLRVGWIPREFHLVIFFTKTMMSSNARNISILSDIASSIGSIDES